MNRNPGMLINLPPHPPDPATPSEQGPGTPNSTTTSVSALSVVAVKDGTMGHATRGNSSSANTLAAERADRISRLAGLERVGTVRAQSGGHLPGSQHQYDLNPQLKERSTVGSASATGSLGGKTHPAWTSETDFDADSKMSETDGDGGSSTGGFSDEDKASLVGFGEGASSTASGPVSTAAQRKLGARSLNTAIAQARYAAQSSQSGGSAAMTGMAENSRDTPMPDGMDVDRDLDMTMEMATPVMPPQTSKFEDGNTELADELRVRLGDNNGRAMNTPPSKQSLGKFEFEE